MKAKSCGKVRRFPGYDPQVGEPQGQAGQSTRDHTRKQRRTPGSSSRTAANRTSSVTSFGVIMRAAGWVFALAAVGGAGR